MISDDSRDPAEKIYIKGLWVSTKPGVSCCGACRQVLTEFAPPETRDFPIVLHSTEKGTALLTSIKELLPFGGDLDSLKKENWAIFLLVKNNSWNTKKQELTFKTCNCIEHSTFLSKRKREQKKFENWTIILNQFKKYVKQIKK